MNNSFLKSFLGEETVTLPVGGAGFLPSGLIGPWNAGVVFRSPSWFELDLAQEEIAFHFREKSGGTPPKYRYYWLDYVAAKEAVKVLQAGGRFFGPETVWRLETPSAKVLSFADEETRDKFGETITYTVTVKTPKAKGRYEFHLLALPFAVQAVAQVLGLIKDPIFTAAELLSSDQVHDDVFEKEMIGDPDDKTPEAMLNSVLGQRRAALWQALGEVNPLAYVSQGEGAYVTKSQNLKTCLGIIEQKWIAPVWCEVSTVFDPTVGGHWQTQEGQDRRSRIAVITRFFNDQKEAQTAATELIERIKASQASSGTTSAPAPATNAEPPIPAVWKEHGKDVFLENLRAVMAKPPMKAAADMGITVDELEAWRPLVS